MRHADTDSSTESDVPVRVTGVEQLIGKFLQKGVKKLNFHATTAHFMTIQEEVGYSWQLCALKTVKEHFPCHQVVRA